MSLFSYMMNLIVTMYNTPYLRKRRESSRPSPWLFANLRKRKDNIFETMKTVKLHLYLNDQKGFPLLNAFKKMGKLPQFSILEQCNVLNLFKAIIYVKNKRYITKL